MVYQWVAWAEKPIDGSTHVKFVLGLVLCDSSRLMLLRRSDVEPLTRAIH